MKVKTDVKAGATTVIAAVLTIQTPGNQSLLQSLLGSLGLGGLGGLGIGL